MITRMVGVLDRFSKCLVLVSGGVAVCLDVWLAARAMGPLMGWSLVAAVGGGVLVRWNRRVGWAVLFGTLYLVPMLLQAVLREHYDSYSCVWLAGGFGGVVGDLRQARWALPDRWRWPLAYWALAVALVWPILVAREVDFYWPLINEYRIANSGLGGPPPVVIVWMLQVVLTHLIGILWFDASWQHASFDNPRRFVQVSILPLAAGAFIGGALAVYQGTVDINFLSGHQWPSLNRATGSLMDGDAFGALAAMWTVLFLALGVFYLRVSRLVVAWCGVGAILAWGGMWATGSRIALAGALVGAVVTGVVVVRALGQLPSARRIGAVVVGGVGLVILAVFLSQFGNDHALGRTVRTLPALNRPALEKFAIDELWNRNGPFGTMTVRILGQFPLTGVGVGSFNHLFTDLAFPLTNWNRHFFDNAQSWYRHQLAELGALGSLGWIAWFLSFVWVVLRSRPSGEFRWASVLVVGALLTIALVSTVAMPTQPFSLSITVWVLAAWHLHLTPTAVERVTRPWPAARSFVVAVVAMLALTVFCGATYRVARLKLRPPQRALLGLWEYRYGYYGIERPPTGPAFWWTKSRAVDVFSVELKSWLKLTIGGSPPDALTNPLEVTIRYRGKVLDTFRVTDGTPRTWYVRMRPDEHHMMLEIQTNRPWRPADTGMSVDAREFGVRVDEYAFVPFPPAGAIIR